MVLNPYPIYYVLRLHRDSQRQQGRLAGRIEHATSNDSTDFATAAELLDWLACHCAQMDDRMQASTDQPPPKDNP